jgi:predicted DNA-binding ArsR family transcriptional regulator
MSLDLASLSAIVVACIIAIIYALGWAVKKYISSTERKINKSEENVNELTKSFNASILLLNKSINELSSILVKKGQIVGISGKNGVPCVEVEISHLDGKLYKLNKK